MKNISVKLLIRLMISVSIIFVGLIGASSYLAIQKLNSAVDATSLIQSQMHADMMHDAIRAEVMSALYAASNGKASELGEFQKALSEHGDAIKSDLSVVAEKLKGSELEAQVGTARSVADQYYNTAQKLLQKSSSGDYQQELSSFNQDYELLEEKLGVIADKIVADTERSSQEAYDAANNASVMVLLIVVASFIVLIPFGLLVFNRVVKPLQLINEIVHGFIKSSDVSKRVEVNRKDEIGLTVSGFNSLMDAVEGLVKDVRLTTKNLFNTCKLLSEQANQGKLSAQANNDAATSVAAAIEELSSSMQEIAAQSKSARESTEQSLNLANKGSQDLSLTGETIGGLAQSVKESADQIQTLEERAKSISQISGDISGIAEQTNLLALNAAIEAARAGENGRGFAVVADEVRSLAERTSESTEKIGGMIQGVQSGTNMAVKKMTDNLNLVDQGLLLTKKTSQTLQDVHEQSSRSAESVAQISFSLQEQNSVVDELTAIVNRVAVNCEHGCEAAIQISEQAEGLAALAQDLQHKVERFQLSQSAQMA